MALWRINREARTLIQMAVTVSNVVKTFGRYPALDNVSIEARDGEFLALLGPSGSGKTTLLRLIAGLDFPDSGQIMFDGENVSDRPARDRQVGDRKSTRLNSSH